jgi:hypothetical protein
MFTPRLHTHKLCRLFPPQTHRMPVRHLHPSKGLSLTTTPPPSTMNIVCIGLDLAWSGGSSRDRSSQADVLIGHEVGSLEVWKSFVDLRGARNHNATRYDAIYDADAELLISAIKTEVARLEGDGASQFVLAIDAPLLCTQVGLGPRPRGPTKGEKVARSRSCEARLAARRSRCKGPWQSGLRIQAGAPLFPRVARLVSRLHEELGFVSWDGHDHTAPRPARTVIEIFPSEALWALGVNGFYEREEPSSVRMYKKLKMELRRRKKQGLKLYREEAVHFARKPLHGFVPLLEGELNIEPAVKRISDMACEHIDTVEVCRMDKRYDDLIDSAIAWLTALTFVHGTWHVFADVDGDGAIVGPGKPPGTDPSVELV